MNSTCSLQMNGQGWEQGILGHCSITMLLLPEFSGLACPSSLSCHCQGPLARGMGTGDESRPLPANNSGGLVGGLPLSTLMRMDISGLIPEHDVPTLGLASMATVVLGPLANYHGSSMGNCHKEAIATLQWQHMTWRNLRKQQAVFVVWAHKPAHEHINVMEAKSKYFKTFEVSQSIIRDGLTIAHLLSHKCMQNICFNISSQERFLLHPHVLPIWIFLLLH